MTLMSWQPPLGIMASAKSTAPAAFANQTTAFLTCFIFSSYIVMSYFGMEQRQADDKSTPTNIGSSGKIVTDRQFPFHSKNIFICKYYLKSWENVAFAVTRMLTKHVAFAVTVYVEGTYTSVKNVTKTFAGNMARTVVNAQRVSAMTVPFIVLGAAETYATTITVWKKPAGLQVQDVHNARPIPARIGTINIAYFLAVPREGQHG